MKTPRQVAEFLQQHEKVAWVQLLRPAGGQVLRAGQEVPAQRLLRRGVLRRKGRPRPPLKPSWSRLKIAAIETHVADARTCCLHPASSTHRQMNDEELKAAGVPADLVRYSCGLEDVEDLIADLAQALDA